MPSKTPDVSAVPWGGPPRTGKEERAIADLGESLRSQIQVLVTSRQSMYDWVEVHRQDGQVVPTSLCEALDENSLRLRAALDRYMETTAALRVQSS
jgi:hypothetical protein